MRNRRLPHFLLLLAFVVGQWMAVVHATRHELTSAKDAATCETCAAAHGSGGIPVLVALVVPFIFFAVSSDASQSRIFVVTAFLRPQGRAPPLLLR